MKFALVDGQRREARPKLAGTCPGCDQPMVAKCGRVRVPHWAHKSGDHCDPWWENESEWHRNWKGKFPADWQEYAFRADDGTQHIADVRTDHGWVIEFQHSPIAPEERKSRDDFYGKIVWVVDATPKRDLAQFDAAWKSGAPVDPRGFVRRVRAEGCRMLDEWATTATPVFFDFGEEYPLGYLLPSRAGEPAFVAMASRSEFVAAHYGTGPNLARNFDEYVRTIEGWVRPPVPSPPSPPKRTQAEANLALKLQMMRGRGRGRL